MTVNHDYNTPEKGQTNWDVPLNENFKRLDADVEIRDSASNVENYDPKQGSKFLASDTGDVYIGDGTEWQSLGTIGERTSNLGGLTVARPGDVQAALDDATYDADWAHAPYNRVVLESGTIYRPTDTWVVGPNTILDFNGALVRPDHSSDVIHVGQRSKLIRPYIDARLTSWSDAAMIVLDTAFGGQYTGPTAPQIGDCRLFAPSGTGTGIVLRDSTEDGMGGGLTIDGQVQGFDRGVRLIADGGSDAFVNTVRLRLKLSKYVVGIEHSAVPGAATNGNYLYVDTQPLKGTSEWLWKLGTESRINTMIGHVWDTSKFKDETVWYIPSDGGWNNTLVDLHQFLGDWQMVDESGRATNGIFRWRSESYQRKE